MIQVQCSTDDMTLVGHKCHCKRASLYFPLPGSPGRAEEHPGAEGCGGVVAAAAAAGDGRRTRDAGKATGQ